MAKTSSRRFGYVSLGGTSKRWRDETTGAIISNRKMSDIAREARLGEKTTKEQFTRGVRQGRYEHVNADQQARASEGKAIRRKIPEIAPKDAAVIVKFRVEGGYAALDDDEQERFEMLFKRYPKDSVREALGSPSKRRSARRRSNNERTLRRPKDRRPGADARQFQKRKRA
jgi:hypothetical protein